MKKIDKAVLTETKYVALTVIILSVLMNAVFLIVGKWDKFVLFGNIAGAIIAIANFFFMALTVSKAVEFDEKKAKAVMRTSQSVRMVLMLVCIIIFASFSSTFNVIALCLPLLFPRVGVLLRNAKLKKGKNNEE